METAFARKPFSTELVSAFSFGHIPGRQANSGLSALLGSGPGEGGSGIQGNYHGPARSSSTTAPDEIGEDSSEGKNKCKIVPDNFSYSFFFFCIFFFSFIESTADQGVFFLLNLDQLIVLAEKC